jgi:predicted ribosome-associated RNA-binding protein Tma20
MFKKATTLNQQKLRGDLVKRLKKDLTLQLALTDDDVDSVFPSKADVLLVKMSNKAVVYTVGGQPLVFDPVRRRLWWWLQQQR